MHEFASAKKYCCLMNYMSLPSAKKTNMKMHEHIGDDRGNRFGFQNILCWLMLVEQAILAGSQPNCLQHLVLPIVAVIKRSPNAASSLQQSPTIKQVATSTTNARITRSSFISTETESTKSSGGCASPHSSCTDTQTPRSKPIKITK